MKQETLTSKFLAKMSTYKNIEERNSARRCSKHHVEINVYWRSERYSKTHTFEVCSLSLSSSLYAYIGEHVPCCVLLNVMLVLLNTFINFG